MIGTHHEQVGTRRRRAELSHGVFPHAVCRDDEARPVDDRLPGGRPEQIRHLGQGGSTGRPRRLDGDQVQPAPPVGRLPRGPPDDLRTGSRGGDTDDHTLRFDTVGGDGSSAGPDGIGSGLGGGIDDRVDGEAAHGITAGGGALTSATARRRVVGVGWP